MWFWGLGMTAWPQHGHWVGVRSSHQDGAGAADGA